VLFILLAVSCFVQAGFAVQEVRIGYFGPSDGDDDMFAAACLAIERANAAGGDEGTVYRLMPCWSEEPWGSGIKQVVRMVYEDDVCAIIGGVDGPTTHLVEQVVAKARLPLINPVSSDVSISLANVPWMYTCVPGDDLQAKALMQTLDEMPVSARIVLLSANDHDSHLFADEIVKALNRVKRSVDFHYEFDHKRKDISELMEQVVGHEPDVLVLSAGVRNCVRIVNAVEGKLEGAVIVGPGCMGSNSFIDGIENMPERIVFPLLYHADRKRVDVDALYFERTGKHLDYRSAYTYDAVNILLDAIGQVGAGRQDLHDRLSGMTPWKGVAGKIQWDSKGRNVTAVGLGTYRHGKLIRIEHP
jgi:ABC-type branched-subunit amino acid transport system substrate-binding protein